MDRVFIKNNNTTKQKEYYKKFRNNKHWAKELSKSGDHYLYTYQSIKDINKHIFPYNFVKDTDTVVSCGCARMYLDMGISDPLIFATLAKKVILFEADPINIPVVDSYLEDNKIGNVELIPKAVWNKNEEVMFSSYKNSPGGGNHVGGGNRKIMVPVEGITLDAAVKEPVDFLHLTINGIEHRVLETAESMLENKPIVTVAMFNKRHEMFKRRKKAVELLYDCGYYIGWAKACSIPWEDFDFWLAIATPDKDKLESLGYEPITELFPV